MNPRFRSAGHSLTVSLGLTAFIIGHAPLAVTAVFFAGGGDWDTAAGLSLPIGGPLITGPLLLARAAGTGALVLVGGVLQLTGLILMVVGRDLARVVTLDGMPARAGLTVGPEGLSVAF